MSGLQTVLMPFGKSNTGILLNILLYVVLLFVIIFFPVYFTQNKSGSNGNLVNGATAITQTMSNIQQQINTLQNIINTNNQLIQQNISNTELVNRLTQNNQQLQTQIDLLKQQIQ